MNLMYLHLNVIIQTWLTLTTYNTLSLQQLLHMCGTLSAEQAAQHTRAFILVFAPYQRLLFTLHKVSPGDPWCCEPSIPTPADGEAT
jgi:hypothetical protein